MEIVNFNLVKKNPDTIQLKAYLYQIINASFGLSDEIQNAFLEKTGDSNYDRIETLSDTEIQEMLGDYWPSTIIYFCAHLDSIEKDKLHYTNYPELFTDIKQVSFDCGGIISMQSYNNQIYTLYNGQGQRLSDHCHDLDIGMNGLILLRSSSRPSWELCQVEGDHLVDIEHPYPENASYDFPDLMYRDAIEESIFPVLCMADLYWDSSHLSFTEAYQKLKNHEGDYRSLISFYEDNEELATFAIEEDILAFTFLSDRLKNNRDFVISLIKKGESFLELYRYLNEELKRDHEIIRLCMEDNTGIIYKIAPVDDREMIRRAIKSSPYHLEFASKRLQSDKDFILELATQEWRILSNSAPSLYTDAQFVRSVLEAYNASHEEKVELIEIVKTIMWKEDGHLLIDSISPIQDEKLFLHLLQTAQPNQFKRMMSGLSTSSIQSQEFWLKAARNNKAIVDSIPKEMRNNLHFAMELIKLNGDFLHSLNPTLLSDSTLFISAISQIRNRRGAKVISDIYPLLTEQLKGDRSFMMDASKLDFHILDHCSDELKGDLDFLKSILKSTYGWSYAYANDELKQNIDFIQETLNINTYLACKIPTQTLENPTVQSIFTSKNIDLNKTSSDDNLPF
jgi:hypothetical protein